MPFLYMLIGLPASGKTSFAKQYSADNVIHISSDAIRKELYGSEEVQDNPNKVFSIMFHRTIDNLLKGNNVIYDATNISRKYRMAFLRDLDAALGDFTSKVTIIGVVFAVPINVCLDRNLARSRSVPEDVIYRMYRNFQVPSVYEGFDHIDIVNPFKNNSALIDIINSSKSISQDNPNHSLTIGDHCEAAANYFSDNRAEIIKEFNFIEYHILYEAALFHDIGKPACKTFVKPNGKRDGKAHYYNHENVGAYIYLCYSEDMDAKDVALLINLHMIHYMDEKFQLKIRSIYGPDIWKRLEWLNKADMAAH